MDLKSAIKDSGVTVTEFARIAKVSRVAVHMWMKKENLEDTSAIRVIEATLEIIKKDKKKAAKKKGG